MKRLAIFAGLLLCSCSRIVSSVVVNHRDVPVVLVYAPTNLQACSARDHRLILAAEVQGGWRVDELPRAEASFDAARCEWRVSLPAGTAVLIASGGGCIDAKVLEKNPGLVPDIAFIRIEAPTGTIEWRGLEVGRKFEDEGGWFSREICRFDYR